MQRTGLAMAAAAIALAASSADATMIQLVFDPTFGSTENTGSTARESFEISEHGLDDVRT